MNKPKYPAVLVRWVDASMSESGHWQDGMVPAKPKGKALGMCETVGWLTHQCSDWVQVVATLTAHQHAHVTEIPTGMVRDIVVLAPAE